MDTIRKSCNVGYFHEPHTAIVVLYDKEGIRSDPVFWMCGGNQWKERDHTP